MFDKDGGGSICATEIRDVLKKGITDEMDTLADSVFHEIVAEVDENGNGEIDFNEFCYMMKRLVQT